MATKMDNRITARNGSHGDKITKAEFLAITKKKGRIKGAKKINTPDGKFDSMAEYERWCGLKLQQLTGKIFNLKRQVAYPVEVNGIHICVWVADYVYNDFQTGKEVVEDLKGVMTDVFKLKRKLVEAYYGFKILVTPAKDYRMNKRRTVW